ncbi:MAG: hypothetical protein WD830_01190 [Chloroflexota bacterium]
MNRRVAEAMLALVTLVAGCGDVIVPTPVPTPATVDGLPLLRVGDVIAARAAGGLRGARVAVYGYWSDGSVGHSCAPPSEPTGELELYCHDGEWGITELQEAIVVVDNSGGVTPANGPHLTPFVPAAVSGADDLFRIAHVRMPGFAPVPITVVGHFDDPRAADCRPQSRQLCLDRLVVERIVQLGDDLE